MAEGTGWAWSQLLCSWGHLLECPGNCEQRRPPKEGVKGPQPLADSNVPVAGAKAGTLNSCLSGSMHILIGISGPAG